MPIREFKCPKGHVTEKILFGAEDKAVLVIMCGKNSRECGLQARRVDFSRTGAPQFYGEGFYAPTRPDLATRPSYAANQQAMADVKGNAPGGKVTNYGKKKGK
jgi:hypothetical protein